MPRNGGVNQVARPLKQGVDYFPSDVDMYTDFKIMDLLDQFGPIGFTVYDWTIRQIYSNGYYLEMELDRMSLYFAKDIGSKWVKNKKIVVQVIHYCADIGLFDKDLLSRNVITSVGLQKRYLEITVRRQTSSLKKFWLLEKVVLNAPINEDIDNNNEVYVYNNSINDGNNATKESKVNKSKEKIKDTVHPHVNKSKSKSNEKVKPVISKKDEKKEVKHKHGEYEHVLLTDEQHKKLIDEYPNHKELITHLDEYIEMKGYKAQNHYLAIKKWVVNAVNEEHQRQKRNENNKIKESEGFAF